MIIHDHINHRNQNLPTRHSVGNPIAKISTVGYWFLLLLAALSSVNFSVVGILYFGDFVAVSGAIFLLISLISGRLPALKSTVGIPGLIAVIGFIYFCLDFINQIEPKDFLRGLAKHVVFVAVTFGMLAIAGKLSIRQRLLLILTVSASPGLMILLGIAEDPMGRFYNFVNWLKYFGGGFALLIPLLAPSGITTIGSCIYLLVAAGVAMLVADSRELAAIFSSVGLLVLIARETRQKRSFRVAKYIFISAACSASIYFAVVNTALLDEVRVERRDDSSRQRLDMATFAVGGLLERPLTGFGSWQGAERYVDPTKPTDYNTIHSMFLQYGYEYGVSGLLLPLLIGGLLSAALFKVVATPFDSSAGVWVVMTCLYLIGLSAVVFGGLNGYGRISTAAILSLSVSSLVKRVEVRGKT